MRKTFRYVPLIVALCVIVTSCESWGRGGKAAGSGGVDAAMTHAAGSCNAADVQRAINKASSGDVVTIPPGSCAWSSGVSIRKGITLQGAGADSTTITVNFNGLCRWRRLSLQ